MLATLQTRNMQTGDAMSSEKEKGPAPDIILRDGALRAAAWREEGD